jgi:hypothetical protein
MTDHKNDEFQEEFQKAITAKIHRTGKPKLATPEEMKASGTKLEESKLARKQTQT